jgi:glycine/D-amino acid oxidase-like deaminating enzyme/nitrite reductase/ring-hydroxylating ferredoxin subunit
MPISLWHATARPTRFASLDNDMTVDVAVIGGGIFGMMAALYLSREGLSVALLEARGIGAGSTGYSTGNLYAPVGAGLAAVERKWGEDAMRHVARSRGEAVDRIEALARELEIDCAFRRCPFHIFSVPGSSPDDLAKLDAEADAAKRAGLSVSMASAAPLPFASGKTLAIEGQAQFQPLDFVRGLATRIDGPSCRIFEGSPATDFDADHKLVRTTRGTVHAAHIVLATHTPKKFNAVQTELGPYREYGVAVEAPEGTIPPGVFWSMEDSRHSLRSFSHQGRHYALAIGERHKTGQEPDMGARQEKLASYLRQHVRVMRESHRWSAQGYYAADLLPYIGRSAGAESLFIATGFGADGLTYGAMAARIVTDAILRRANPYAELYEARRVRPVKAGAKFVKENVNVAGEYVKDYADLLRAGHADELRPGEGRIVEIRGRHCAAHRTDDGRLLAVSPVCTHLKCIVHWNNAERSWDCPCHGSRFDVDGSVLEGPAATALERIDFDAAGAG